MKLVVGLGNPGPKYETTRHNAGFLAIDRLLDRWKAGPGREDSEAEVYPCTVGGEKCLLIKPETYMNNSGRAVGPLFKFYKCEPGDLVVVYDELDLKPGALRLKQGGGAGGHNGIKSIDAHLGAGSLNYHRVRIGIGHPSYLAPQMAPADFVLQAYSDEELRALDPLLDDVAAAVEMILRGDAKGAMNLYNRNRESAGTAAGSPPAGRPERPKESK